MRAAWKGLGDGTRAIGVTPAVSAATQIIAAVSSDVALCSRSTKMASKPHARGDHRRLGAAHLVDRHAQHQLACLELFFALFSNTPLVTNFLSSLFAALERSPS